MEDEALFNELDKHGVSILLTEYDWVWCFDQE